MTASFLRTKFYLSILLPQLWLCKIVCLLIPQLLLDTLPNLASDECLTVQGEWANGGRGRLFSFFHFWVGWGGCWGGGENKRFWNFIHSHFLGLDTLTCYLSEILFIILATSLIIIHPCVQLNPATNVRYFHLFVLLLFYLFVINVPQLTSLASTIIKSHLSINCHGYFTIVTIYLLKCQ